MSKTVEWLAGINALLGVWLVAVPLLLADLGGGFSFWNAIFVGIGVIVFAGYNWIVAEEDEQGSLSAASLSALLGLYIVAMPFLVLDADGWVFLNYLVVGALVFLLAIYNAYETVNYEDVSVRTTG